MASVLATWGTTGGRVLLWGEFLSLRDGQPHAIYIWYSGAGSCEYPKGPGRHVGRRILPRGR